MRPFRYLHAEDTDTALALLSQPGAAALAGGTTLLDLMKLDVETPTWVVDIQALPWKDISVDDGALSIGALSSNTAVADHPLVSEHFPVIAQAILSGASGQIRNMATVGGNIMQRTRCPYFRQTGWACNKRTSGSGCSAASGHHELHAVLGVSDACFAVYPSDLAVALVAADASVVLVSQTGERTVALTEFLVTPDATPERETLLQPGELIKAVTVPLPAQRPGRYLKLRDRAAFAFATVSVAASLRLEGGKVTQVAVALGGVGTVPWRSPAAEQELIGDQPSRAALESFCDTLLAGATPRKATAYKLNLARGALSRVFDELAGQS
jgi:xanthine dehydrogenase YagS FAD-binding subunit